MERAGRPGPSVALDARQTQGVTEETTAAAPLIAIRDTDADSLLKPSGNRTITATEAVRKGSGCGSRPSLWHLQSRPPMMVNDVRASRRLGRGRALPGPCSSVFLHVQYGHKTGNEVP